MRRRTSDGGKGKREPRERRPDVPSAGALEHAGRARTSGAESRQRRNRWDDDARAASVAEGELAEDPCGARSGNVRARTGEVAGDPQGRGRRTRAGHPDGARSSRATGLVAGLATAAGSELL